MRHCVRTLSFPVYDWIFQSSFSFRTSDIVAPSCHIGFMRSCAQISLLVTERPCAVGCARGGSTNPHMEPVFKRPNFQGQAQLCVQEYGLLRLESAQSRPPEKTDDVGGIPRAWFLSEASAYDLSHAGQGDPFHQKTASPSLLLTPLAPLPWLLSSLPCADRAPCFL